MLRLFATVFVVVFALGCPILDELDKGNKEMDKFSPGARALNEKKAKEAEAKKQASSGPSKLAGATAGAKDAASKWWGKARSLAPDETSSDVVRCVLNGSDQYMSKNDCLMRGGSVAKTGKPL
jgi:hypothetical protein